MRSSPKTSRNYKIKADSQLRHNVTMTQPSQRNSKISQGPKNARHEKFVKNDILIRQEIMKAIAERNISLRVAEVCRAAKISNPTFYLHHGNCNEAKEHYESVILDDFLDSRPVGATKLMIFEFLLSFAHKHAYYFRSVDQACDMYVLTKILGSVKRELVSSNISAESYDIYAMTIAIMVCRWIREDSLDIINIPKYAHALMRVRVMKY